MKLFVARHGETAYNRQKKFYGSDDVSLDSQGEKQAQMLAHKLTDVPLTQLVRSQMRRTEQTLRPVAAQHPAVPVTVYSELNEKGFGDWEGLDADEIQAKDPLNWQKWLNEPLTFTPPTVESFAVFKHRVAAGMARVLANAQPNDQILLVAHLGTLRVMHQLLCSPKTNFWDIHFDAGTYSYYEVIGKSIVLKKLNV